MKVTFLGHAALLVDTGKHRILFDPFLTGNGAASVTADEVEADVILLTHAHGDHVGDTVAIAKRTGAQVVAVFELAAWLMGQGIQVHPMHLGGSHTFDFGTVKYTLAFHGSGIETPDGILYGGNPAGILLTVDGKTLFHAGDTALFGDMKLIGDMNDIDLAVLPIGDNFTMGPEDAVVAATWLHPKAVLPVHYNTFPLIAQDGQAFGLAVERHGIHAHILESGQSVEI
ncbi:metal-dependent hydrolase [Ferroacidibacillus organovorans]|uniref:UPF0173 metal-dependent hydrolase B2M26_12750 n=1 Tax=Ferroacidibacillus organovorans TaxID=1765683 RepID=A0A162UMU0_9BACL|nr:metal-dependent hydrolase [Ferroacidibacillus organovorans]KYP81886.1 metal-dependent hydrolase [Ferroacidibacillus organovorans]OPG15323.1 metal-dependent hydrolase [Ferroacidibacillus organovorans]